MKNDFNHVLCIVVFDTSLKEVSWCGFYQGLFSEWFGPSLDCDLKRPTQSLRQNWASLEYLEETSLQGIIIYLGQAMS